MASAPETSNVIVSDDFSALSDDLVFQISSLVCRSTYQFNSFYFNHKHKHDSLILSTVDRSLRAPEKCILPRYDLDL